MKKKYYGYVIAVTIFLAVISYFVDRSEMREKRLLP